MNHDAVPRTAKAAMTRPLITKRMAPILFSDVSLAAVSGLLLTAAFPKLEWESLAWVALVPLFWAIKDSPPSRSFKLGFLAGFAHYVSLLYWIAQVVETYGQLPTVLGWSLLFLLAAYLSLYPACFALVLTRLRAYSPALLWGAPFLWVSLEYVRASFLSGFPWENLGYSQHTWLHLIQISDILGVYGVSALVVAVNAALFALWDALARKRGLPWIPVLAIALTWGVFLSYGTWRMTQVEAKVRSAPKHLIALVQGNIDQTKKWLPAFQGKTLKRYGNLSLSVLESQPELMVWPETALPFYFLHNKPLTKEVVDLVRACQVHFLIGSPSFCTSGSETRYYNSAYLLDPSGQVVGKYDKVHLVPYGEYVPLKRFFPFLGKLVEGIGDFEPGKKGKVLTLNHEKFGILICFEVIFPELARAVSRNEAQFLVNITNDAWFGTSSAPYQHLSMAVFRAVESHLAVVRAANTGISAFIDPAGRILDATPLFEEAVRVRPIPMMDHKTFYVRYGDLFAVACMLITVVIGIGTFRYRSVANTIAGKQ